LIDQAQIEAIDGCVASAMAAQRIPGISLAIGRAGRVEYARGYGYRNVAERIQPDADTIFSIASISKQFTAAAILHLVERGVLSLDDSLARLFPRIPSAADIQVRHLLGHTSGIPGYTEIADFDQFCRTSATPEEVIATVAERVPVFAPEAEWQYGNTNYVLLGSIIETVTGESYAEFLSKLIWVPLELTRTGVNDAATIRENKSNGYSAYSLGDIEYATEWDPSWAFATGGLYSTVNDLVRWNYALRSGRVVAPDSFTRMTTSGRLKDGTDTQYGLGLFVDNVEGVREVRHSGGLPGFSLMNATYPELDLDIVVLANVDGIRTYLSIVRPILAILLDRPDISVWHKPELPASAIAKSESLDPSSWIGAARAGRIDELPLEAEFKRFLTPHRRAALEELSLFGELREIELIETDRRDPETSFHYRAAFQKRVLEAIIIVVDTGEIRRIGFREWDERRFG
jgi:CubicO group peptidase (beta-lactamase class C family)